MFSLRFPRQEQWFAEQEPERGKTMKTDMGRISQSGEWGGKWGAMWHCVDMPSGCLASVQVMCQSHNQIVSHCFRREEVMDQKRPEMVRTSLFLSLSVCHSLSLSRSLVLARWLCLCIYFSLSFFPVQVWFKSNCFLSYIDSDIKMNLMKYTNIQRLSCSFMLFFKYVP